MDTIDSLFINTTEERLAELTKLIDSLQSQVVVQQERTDILTGILETSNDSISNQLSSASYLLAVIAVVIAIVGGILGYYIRRKKIDIDSISTIIDEKKNTIDMVASATEKLDKQIRGNIGELYKELRNEETKTILDRLVLEPQDIGNLIRQLYARDLEEDCYAKLREAYLKLKQEPEEDREEGKNVIRIALSDEDQYISLFFQHFCLQAIRDDEIRADLMKGFNVACQHAFRRDMIKTTICLCKALSDETASFNKEEVLIEYLKAINGSKHRSCSDLKNILEQNIMPQTLLKSAIEKCKKDGVYLELFGITEPEGEGLKAEAKAKS